MSDDQFDRSWPRWPPGAVGTTCVDVQIGWSVDTTFDKLWGAGSEFSAHVREARNIKDYAEGPWVLEEDLEDSIRSGQQDKTPPSPRSFASRSGYAGYSRRVKFEQAGSGGVLSSAYTNAELQRCIEAVEGERYLLNCCIASNAPYADRIRIVLRYELTAVPDESDASNLKISYDVVWVKSTNSMLKYTITTGIDMGVKKNFGTLRGLLQELVEVKSNLPDGQAAPAEARSPEQEISADGAAAPPIASAAPLPTPAFALLGRLARSEAQLLRSAAPIASWLDGRAASSGHDMAKKLLAAAGGRDAATTAVAAGVVVALLWAVLLVKGLLGSSLGDFCMEEGCNPGAGQAVCFLYSLGHVVDLPDSLREVAGAVVILGAVQWAASVALAALPIAAPALQAADPVPAPPAEAASRHEEAAAEGAGREASKAGPEGSPEAATRQASAVQAEMAKQLSNLGSGLKSGLKDISSSTSSAIRNLARSSTSPGQYQQTKEAPKAEALRTPRLSEAGDTSLNASSEYHEEEPVPPPPAAEVFENERYQPLRGWGHTWPGHLMPGDFSHWSLPSDDSSMVFSEVRPCLPDGYQWADPEWQIDMSGAEDEAVDEEGWSYGVHWKWLTNPPQPGLGRRKGGVFVRRRRWFRRWSAVPEGQEQNPGDDDKEPQPTKNPEEDKLANTLASMSTWVGGSAVKDDAAQRSSPALGGLEDTALAEGSLCSEGDLLHLPSSNANTSPSGALGRASRQLLTMSSPTIRTLFDLQEPDSEPKAASKDCAAADQDEPPCPGSGSNAGQKQDVPPVYISVPEGGTAGENKQSIEEAVCEGHSQPQDDTLAASEGPGGVANDEEEAGVDVVEDAREMAEVAIVTTSKEVGDSQGSDQTDVCEREEQKAAEEGMLEDIPAQRQHEEENGLDELQVVKEGVAQDEDIGQQKDEEIVMTEEQQQVTETLSVISAEVDQESVGLVPVEGASWNMASDTEAEAAENKSEGVALKQGMLEPEHEAGLQTEGTSAEGSQPLGLLEDAPECLTTAVGDGHQDIGKDPFAALEIGDANAAIESVGVSSTPVVTNEDDEGWLDDSFTSELLKPSTPEAEVATPDAVAGSLGSGLEESDMIGEKNFDSQELAVERQSHAESDKQTRTSEGEHQKLPGIQLNTTLRGNKFKQIMQSAQQEGKKVSGVVGKKVSGAVASVGHAIGNVTAGSTHAQAQSAESQEPGGSSQQEGHSEDAASPFQESAAQAAFHDGAFPIETNDMFDIEPSVTPEGGMSSSAAPWPKRTVSDMFKEVNLDNVQGTAQRVGAEMNVAAKKISGEMNDAAKKISGEMNDAAKKLSGEMNDAAKKLSGLFGRTVAVTRMGLSKTSSDATDNPNASTAEQSSRAPRSINNSAIMEGSASSPIPSLYQRPPKSPTPATSKKDT